MSRRLKVLLIEDNQDDADLILRTLQKAGYEVEWERVWSEANLQTALYQQDWDLLLSDYSMPGFDGVRALGIVKERGLDQPFILVSGSIGETCAVEAMRSGAHDYVMKNSLARLAPVVERELREYEVRRAHERADKVQKATYRISASTSSTENMQELFEQIHAVVGELMSARNFYIALYSSENDSIYFPYFVDELDPTPTPFRRAKGLTEWVLRSGQPLLASPEIYQAMIASGEIVSIGTPSVDWLGVPLKAKGETFGVLVVQSYTQGTRFGNEEREILEFVSTQVAMAITRKQAEQAMRESEARYRGLFEDSPISLWEEDFTGLYHFLEELRRDHEQDLGDYLRTHPERLDEGMAQVKVVDVNQATLRLYGADSKEQLLSNLDKVLRNETRQVFLQEILALASGKTEFEGYGINYRLNGEPIECILRWSLMQPPAGMTGGLGPMRIIISVVDVTRQKQVENQVQQQLQRMGALRSVDMAITASMDLRVTLAVLLDQVTTQLRVDAADVLLFNPVTQTMEYAAGRGFHSSAVSRVSIPAGEGYVGKALSLRRSVAIPDLQQAQDGARSLLFQAENFSSYLGTPLISKGQVKGVLEVFQRGPLDPGPEWLDFLETLAGQAAIAVESAQLFENLQHSNLELARAYDATIEGWSRALDLRDKETEGHTTRVTDLTLRLAVAMGYADEKLEHMRRGALLHDIGKMGIADKILLKPGPLTDEEWEIMRRHPVYAYELLSPVDYLRPALDIPYCHHEKWDGSGYPRGLKGEQIPLSARIFAVVDVWDALSSDRPYRKAWPADRVRAHLQAEAGRHFDPQVVDMFLRLEWNPAHARQENLDRA